MEEQLTQIFKKLKHNNTETKDASYYIGNVLCRYMGGSL